MNETDFDRFQKSPSSPENTISRSRPASSASNNCAPNPNSSECTPGPQLDLEGYQIYPDWTGQHELFFSMTNTPRPDMLFQATNVASHSDLLQPSHGSTFGMDSISGPGNFPQSDPFAHISDTQPFASIVFQDHSLPTTESTNSEQQFPTSSNPLQSLMPLQSSSETSTSEMDLTWHGMELGLGLNFDL